MENEKEPPINCFEGLCEVLCPSSSSEAAPSLGFDTTRLQQPPRLYHPCACLGTEKCFGVHSSLELEGGQRMCVQTCFAFPG